MVSTSPGVVVGMSGGVDSSVAAAILLERGERVIGVTLHLWDYQREGHAGRCCAPEDQHDARRVCDTLGIPHYTFDRRALFREAVVDRFVREHLEGRTPSPCVHCNENVKLGPLLAIARRLGAERVATGHYARIAHDGAHGVALRAATDTERDQSYFLWAAPIDALRALELPLGELDKPAVRRHAERLGLINAAKPDSTDLCFVEGADHGAWLAAHTPASAIRPGPVETSDGVVLGAHEGIHHFTVGQRRGLGASGGPPKYVLRVVPERGAVVVGSADEAAIDRVEIERVRWLVDARPTRVRARLRYRHVGEAATVESAHDDARATLILDRPQRGAAPGQAAVLYDGDRVVGGGWIA